MNDNLDQLNEQNDIDLSSTDTSYPLLPKGAYEFVVSGCVVKDGKKEGSKVLEIKLALDQIAKSTTGQDLNPGFPLTTRISITPAHNPGKKPYTMEDIKRNLAVFQEATIGRKESLQPTEKYVGQKVRANISIRNDPEYGPQNQVDRFLKKS